MSNIILVPPLYDQVVSPDCSYKKQDIFPSEIGAQYICIRKTGAANFQEVYNNYDNWGRAQNDEEHFTRRIDKK